MKKSLKDLDHAVEQAKKKKNTQATVAAIKARDELQRELVDVQKQLLQEKEDGPAVIKSEGGPTEIIWRVIYEDPMPKDEPPAAEPEPEQPSFKTWKAKQKGDSIIN